MCWKRNIKENTFSVLFVLVRAGLWEEGVRLLPYDNVSYDEVMRLAEEQSVIGLVAAGLEKLSGCKAPQEVSLQLAGQALQLEQRNIGKHPTPF